MIYKDKTGHIKGYLRTDGYWWIEEFFIRPNFRRKGIGRKLSSHLPRKCKLLAQPLYNGDGPHITKDALIKFYISLGFEEIQNEYGNTIMTRN